MGGEIRWPLSEIVYNQVISPPGEIADEDVELLSEKYRKKLLDWHENLVPSEDDYSLKSAIM